MKTPANSANNSDHSLRRASRIVAFAAASVGLVLLIHFAPPLGSGLWRRTLQDTLHVPVFAAITLSIFLLTGDIARGDIWRRLGITAAAVFAISLASEALQIPGPRDASVHDLVSDWLGAAGMLLILMAIKLDRRRPAVPLLASCVAVVLVGTALAPLFRVAAAYAERDLARPVVLDAEWQFVMTFVRPQNSGLVPVSLPDDSADALELRFREGAWPGIIIHDIWPDWRGFETLEITLEVPDDEPLALNVRIHDAQHRRGEQPYSDRFNREFTLAPGPHRLTIPLTEIAIAPATRRLDLSAIDGIVLFGRRSIAGRRLYLKEIRLSGRNPG